MRWYWTRIALGALAIFVAGYGAVLMVRSGTSSVRNAVSSGVSLPASLIHFRVDGEVVGSITHVRVAEGKGTSPELPVSLAIRVDLRDSTPALTGCLLLLDELTQVEAGAPFRCWRDGDSVPGYVQLGEVEIRQGGNMVDRLTLLVPESEKGTLVASSRQTLEDRLRAAREATASDRLRSEAQRAADSLAALAPPGVDSL